MKKNIRLTAALLAVLTLFPAARVYETPVYSVSAAQTNISVSNEASTLFSSLAKKLLADGNLVKVIMRPAKEKEK